jgi:hypothetical protein
MNRIVVGVAVALALSAAACGSKSSGGGDGGVGTSLVACNITAGHTCYTYTVPTADVSSANSACATAGGTVVTTCPAGSVGTCTYTGTGTQAGWSITFDFYAPLTATAGHTACQAVGGTWSGGYCPSTSPLDCGNGKCCGVGYPYNCPVQGHCWSTIAGAMGECGSSYATCY